MLGRLGVLGIAAIAVMLASPSNASQMRSFRVGDWQGGAYSNDQTGAFSHCAGSARYRSGILVIFSISRNFTWAMSFVHPDWRLPEGNAYDVAFTVDDMSPLPGRATAITHNHVRVPLHDNVELFNRFRKGRQLRVAAAGQVFAFNLDQTSRLLDELLQCTRLAGRAPAVAANPFEAPKKADRPAQADRPNRAADPLLYAEAATLAANVLSKSGMQGFSLLSTERAADLKSHAAWSAEDKTLGMLSILPGYSEAKDLPKIVIARDAGLCKGNFLSGAIPEDGKTPMARIFTTCQEAGDKSSTIYYLAVPRKKGGLYVFSTLSAGSEGPAKSATESIRNVVLDLKD